MAVLNIDPIFGGKPGPLKWGSTDGDGGAAGPLKTANIAKDGTGTVLTILPAASNPNGVFVNKIKFRAAGTNVATVARIFLNNGSVNTNLANNILFQEITIDSTTISEVAALKDNEVVLNFPLPAGYQILLTIGTTIAAGLWVSLICMDYTPSA